MSSSDSESYDDTKRKHDEVDVVNSDEEEPVKRPRIEPQWLTELRAICESNISALEKFGSYGGRSAAVKGPNAKFKIVKQAFTAPPGLVTKSDKHTLRPKLAGLGHCEDGNLAKAVRKFSLVWGLPIPDDLKQKSPDLEHQHQEFIEEMKELTTKLFRFLFENEKVKPSNDLNKDIHDAIALQKEEFNKNHRFWQKSFTLLTRGELIDALTSAGYSASDAKDMIKNSGILSNSEVDEDDDKDALETIISLIHAKDEEKKQQWIDENAFKNWLGKTFNIGFITQKDGRDIMYIQFESSSSFPDKKKDPTAMEDVGNPAIQAVMDIIGPWSMRTEINPPKYAGPNGHPLIDPVTKKPYNDLVKIHEKMDPKYLEEEVLREGDLVQLKFALRLSLSSQGKSIKAEPFFNSIVLHKRSEGAAKIVGESSVSVPDYGFGDEDPFADGGDTF